MSEFLTAPLRPPAEPGGNRTLETLATLLVIVLAVSVLYVGREVFVPVAIAILLSFILSPLARQLRHFGVGRVSAVWIVAVLALALTGAVSAILTRQVSEFATDLPKYEATVNAKVQRLRDAAADNPAFAKVEEVIRSFGRYTPQPAAPRQSTGGAPTLDAATRPPQPVPVEVYQPAPGPFVLVQMIAGTALAPLAATGIVVVFVIFIMLQREDLRDRFIRLVGAHDLQRTTVAMNDAARRLSRYLLMQTLVNSVFGLVVALGLALIGVPSPVLWGIVALLMRFVPYIGAAISALLPLAVAAAVDPGWSMVIETGLLYLVLEPILGQVVEPWLYGHHTGISPIAVVVSATFWTWLWGPVGLVLSTPLTVCLVVLGRHVERLAFLDVIFGDAPPLTPVESFYQRLLAADASEIADQAEQFLRGHQLVDYYDEVALQALLLGQTDAVRGALDVARQARARDTVGELIEDLADHADAPATPPDLEPAEPYASLGGGPPWRPQRHNDLRHLPPEALATDWGGDAPVLCVAGRSALDEAAAMLFAQLLGTYGVGTRSVPAEAVSSSRIGALAAAETRLVLLSYLDPDLSLAHARYAIRRLRRRCPGAVVVVGFWAAQGDARRLRTLAEDCGADHGVGRFADALALVTAKASAADAAPALAAAG
jgi:predicted PurR-regulated permease PerM